MQRPQPPDRNTAGDWITMWAIIALFAVGVFAFTFGTAWGVLLIPYWWLRLTVGGLWLLGLGYLLFVLYERLKES